MTVRYKKSGELAGSSRFNTHALGEVLTGDDSAFIRDLDVQLASGEWKDMSQAFADGDLIPDSYNAWFGEPANEEERTRGYFL